MRTTEERLQLIRQRTAELKALPKQDLPDSADTPVPGTRRQRLTDILCIAASLALVLFLGLSIEELSSRIAAGNVSQISGTASLLGGTAASGYILVGLLCFILGMAVTVLLFKLHHSEASGTDREDDDEL